MSGTPSVRRSWPDRQLALALGHVESFAREDFLAGASNEVALNLIESWPDWPDRAVVLVGPEGSGKSHLAAIWAGMAGARIASARALAADQVPMALATGALVLEDLRPGQFEENALFHLLNLAREERAYLLLTARSAPSHWPVILPDVISRLRLLPVVTLEPPDDALLRAVMVKLFADRQVAVDQSVIEFLATRIDRTFADTRRAVDRLDREALRLQRPISRALAASLFREP